MRNLQVTFDVVSISNPGASSNVVRYYLDTERAIYDIIHDYLMIFFKIKGIGFVNLKITAERGGFSNDSMQRVRKIINQILSVGDGEIPMTDLQKSILLDHLNQARKK